MALYYAKEVQATFAHAQYPDTPQATDSERYASCHVHGSNDWIYRSFLQHDLGYIPYKSHIVSAKLWVRCFYQHDNASSATHNLTRVMEPWDEKTLTWNNKPEQNTEMYLDEWATPPAVGTWGCYDITRMVQEWIDGIYPNYGLQFVNRNEGAYRTEWCFSNRRDSGGSRATYIEIEYEPSEEYRISQLRMEEIAGAIREKTGISDTLSPAEIVQVIKSVNLALQEKVVIPRDSEQIVTPDNGYYGLSKVTVGSIGSDDLPDNAHVYYLASETAVFGLTDQSITAVIANN